MTFYGWVSRGFFAEQDYWSKSRWDFLFIQDFIDYNAGAEVIDEILELRADTNDDVNDILAELRGLFRDLERYADDCGEDAVEDLREEIDDLEDELKELDSEYQKQRRIYRRAGCWINEPKKELPEFTLYLSAFNWHINSWLANKWA